MCSVVLRMFSFSAFTLIFLASAELKIAVVPPLWLSSVWNASLQESYSLVLHLVSDNSVTCGL